MNQQELRDKFFTATVTVNEEGFQKDQADKCVVIAEDYAKGQVKSNSAALISFILQSVGKGHLYNEKITIGEVVKAIKS